VLRALTLQMLEESRYDSIKIVRIIFGWLLGMLAYTLPRCHSDEEVSDMLL